ncbi:MAG: BatD family protein [Elusimicrobia bacterium]|nr:BatD family protein [Elusimicrobiota bacterium]
MSALWLAAALAWAQQPGVQITAEVDRQAVTLDGQIVLTVSIAGSRADLPEPELPSIPNFQVYSSGRNQEIAFTGGQVTGTVVHTFTLQPRFVGKSVIGPIAVTVDGRRHETAPIAVQVLRPNETAPGPRPPSAPRGPAGGTPAGGAGPDVFVTAVVDKPKAYVNEQVTLTVRFHTAVTLLGNPSYTPPTLNGFLSEDLPPAHHDTVRAHGRVYRYSEIRTALFPAQSGKLTIGPALVQAQVQSGVAVDPFAPDFFQKFFSQGLLAAQTRELRTDPIVVTAEPLPEGKPAAFSGAVGQFRITGTVEKKSLKVGDALNLIVTVEGTGNLKALGTIKIPDSPSFRAYETVSSLNLSRTGDAVKGSKVFRTVLVPRVSGTLTIPSIPFGYFDPQKRAYVNAGTAPIEVEVAPASGGSGPTYVAPSGGGGEVTTVLEDIRYIKESSEPPGSALLAAVASRSLIHLIPLAVFLASLTIGGYRERLLLDPLGARFRRAAGRAEGILQEAESFAESDAGKAAAKVAEALTGFIADKLGRSPSGLTLREAQEALRKRFPSVGSERIERLKQLWEEVEELRFSRGSESGAGHAVLLAHGVAELVKELDRDIGSFTGRNGATLKGSPGRPGPGETALLLALALGTSAWASAPGFQQANELYRQGKYSEAADFYRGLTAAAPGNAHLHYNLANARFKEGAPHALGLAIAGYLRAWELSPRDPDVRHNLEFALSRAGEALVPAGTPRALFGLFHYLSRSELLGLQWFGYWACLLLGSAFLLAPALRERLKPAVLFVLIFWAVFGGWWAARTLTGGGPVAVVLEPNAEARSGPGRNFPVGFNAPEGRRVVVLGESGNWIEVGVLKEGLKGWMEAKHLERVF